MKPNLKKTLTAWLLALAMLLSLLPTVALAASGEAEEEESADAEQVEELTAVGQTEDSVIKEETAVETVSGQGYQLTEDSEAATSGTCGKNLTWTLDEDGVLTISGTGTMTSYATRYSAPWYSCYESILYVVIENGVTNIGAGAFSDCINLTGIDIGQTVTSIEDSAFYCCTGLKDITLPDNVISIDAWAFYGCTGLTSFDTGNGLTSVGNSAFLNCTGLTTVTIRNSVSSIEAYAFFDCTGLTDLTIGNNVTSIGTEAFYGCVRLSNLYIADLEAWLQTEFAGVYSNPLVYTCDLYLDGELVTDLIIPNTVTSITDYAFYGCTSLISITIPDSVTDIGDYALTVCYGLTEIFVSAGNENYSSVDGVLFNADQTELICYPIGRTNNIYIVPDGVITICGGSFFCCTSLESVTIPDSVTTIEGSAFENCSSLITVIISSSMTSIGYAAFYDCDNLLYAYYSGSEGEWDSITISSLNSCLTDATITYNSTEPEYSGSCGDTVTWTIESGVLTISGMGEMKYYGYNNIPPWHAVCMTVTSIVIESDITGIDTYTFYDCGHTAEFQVAEDNTAYCTVNGVIFSKDMTEIVRCPSGKTGVYTIPDGVTDIGLAAFYGCTGLTDIVVSDSVISIDTDAFWNCTSLTSFTIPDSVTSLGVSVFDGCTGLSCITIGNGLTSIYGSFYGCTGLTSIVIPDSVISIDAYAFYGCTNLTSIAIPDSVISIGSRAFYNCTSLATVSLGNGVTSIGEHAFRYCKNLTSITIPDSVTSIGGSAFYGCTGLTSITIGSSVTSISNRAFYGCTGLTSITIGSGVTSIGNNAFYNTAFYNDESNWEDGVLYLGNYLLTADADSLEDSYAIKEGTTVIAVQAFYNCTGLTGVTIGSGVTSIGNSAFHGCTGLTDVTIGSSVTTIGSSAFYNTALYNDEDNWEDGVLYLGNCLLQANAGALKGSYAIKEGTTVIADDAFSGCIGMTSITIPDSVTSIGYYAFENCTGLTSVTIGSGVTSIDSKAFYSCTGLTGIQVSADNTAYCSVDGVLFNKSMTSLICYPAGKTDTSYSIPDSVTSIGEFAFYYCKNLTSVAIPDSVASIGSYAFYKCTRLTDFYYSGSEDDWAAITVDGDNDRLSSATIHYNSTGPDDTNTGDTNTGSTDTGNTNTGDTDTGSTDTGSTDTGSTDTGNTDTGNTDTGDTDTGSTDTGDTGTGDTDTGSTDTGDTGTGGTGTGDTDTGSTDTGDTDTGNTDTGDTGTGDSGTGDSGAAHTHSYTCAVTKAATCTTDGVTTYTCECGASYTETIPATGHTWDEGVVTLVATRVSEGEKTYTCTVCGETKTEVIPVLTTATFLFSDVTNEESWYYSAVYWAYDLSITAGYDDGTFRPNSNCTRAEFTTFLYALANAYGLENAGDTASTSFTDVKSGSWYYTYVMWAAENGLVSGYSDGTFKPNNQITRVEAVTMLYGFYKTFVNGGTAPELEETENSFSDLSEDSWYYTYMAWAIQNEVVSGYPDGTCRPNISCTRSVMVVLLHATAEHLL